MRHPPLARPRQISDEDILKAVRKCVFHHGPSVSTVCIAESIGVSQATLFKRFGDKANLILQALLPDERPAFLDLVESGPCTDVEIQAQLVEIGVAALAHFRKVMPRIMALRQAGNDPRTMLSHFDVPPPVRVLMALCQWFYRANEMGQLRCDDHEATALTFLGSLHVRVFFDIMMGPSADGQWQGVRGTDQHHVENLVNNLWRGLAPDGGTS